MFIRWNDSSVRLTGRWSRNGEQYFNRRAVNPEEIPSATTSAPGSYFELAFTGRAALLHFDTDLLATPFPHLWISVDGGARVEVPVDRYLRIDAGSDGNHIVTVIFKAAVLQFSRWYRPLTGAISFMGFEADGPGVLPADDRPVIEFIGDSITEGVLIDVEHFPDAFDPLPRVYQDDCTATYAWLISEALNLRPVFQAYGAVGLTKAGCASVPRAAELYPYAYDGAPYVGPAPRVILINHGCNDQFAPKDLYLQRYGELLDTLRAAHPDAIIVALSAFCGYCDAELASFIPAYNAANSASVHFISGANWVPLDPIHPLRDGHQTIARNLLPTLKALLGDAVP